MRSCCSQAKAVEYWNPESVHRRIYRWIWIVERWAFKIQYIELLLVLSAEYERLHTIHRYKKLIKPTSTWLIWANVMLSSTWELLLCIATHILDKWDLLCRAIIFESFAYMIETNQSKKQQLITQIDLYYCKLLNYRRFQSDWLWHSIFLLYFHKSHEIASVLSSLQFIFE